MAMDLSKFKRSKGAGNSVPRRYISFVEGTEGFKVCSKARSLGLNLEALCEATFIKDLDAEITKSQTAKA